MGEDLMGNFALLWVGLVVCVCLPLYLEELNLLGLLMTANVMLAVIFLN